MSAAAGEAITIPARLTARQLADEIGVEVSEVEAGLRTRSEPSMPEDYISADVAVAVARDLGVEVTIEPRDLALELLYEYELRGELVDEGMGRAARLVAGVVESIDELDDLIESASEHWSVARMPVVDRNILRIGLQELRSGDSPSTAVIISEAVRLAQTYSTERSAAFVNGVLATLARSVRGG